MQFANHFFRLRLQEKMKASWLGVRLLVLEKDTD
jgi:hypothetical protein